MGVWDGAPRHDIWHILRYAWEANYWDAYHLGESWFSKKWLELGGSPPTLVKYALSEGGTAAIWRGDLAESLRPAVGRTAVGGVPWPRSHWKKGALRGRRFNHVTCEQRFLEGTRVKPFQGSPAFKVFSVGWLWEVFPGLEATFFHIWKALASLASWGHLSLSIWDHLRLICGLFTGITMALGFLNNNKPLGSTWRSCRCCLLAKNLGHRTSPQK